MSKADSIVDPAPSSFDPFDLDYLANPYPTLAKIQEETPALHVDKQGGFFLVTRFDDVCAVSKNHAVFSSTGGVGVEWKSRPMMPMYDPPKHTELRRMVGPYFVRRALEVWAGAIRDVVNEVLDRARDAPIDVVRDVAEPISLVTLATLLGVPKERRDDLSRWADNTMAELAGGITDEQAVRLDASRREFNRYLRASIEERRAKPGRDLLSVLLGANEADRLTEKEMVAFCVLLLVAGFEPSASAITNSTRALALHEFDLRRLPENKEGVDAAAWELLRWDSPVQAFFRNTLADTQVGSVAIPKDSKVMIHFAAANRDPRVFRDPERLDLARSPNPAIPFGVGVHHCLGSALAQMQMAAYLDGLRARFQRIEVCEPERRKDNLLFRNLSRYKVRLIPH